MINILPPFMGGGSSVGRYPFPQRQPMPRPSPMMPPMYGFNPFGMQRPPSFADLLRRFQMPMPGYGYPSFYNIPQVQPQGAPMAQNTLPSGGPGLAPIPGPAGGGGGTVTTAPTRQGYTPAPPPEPTTSTTSGWVPAKYREPNYTRNRR